MYMSAATLDDLLHRTFTALLKTKNHITATKGAAAERTGVLLQLTDPRARLSRTEIKGTLFSCVGELLWYLSGTNDLPFVEYYLSSYTKFSDDGFTVYGGYGPRVFDMRGNNQLENIVSLLTKKPTSRRAVIQLFDAGDLAEDHKDIPCTCALQFILRRARLSLISYMRSSDAFLGLPHDAFCFTMLQEVVARRLGVELGAYKHSVGSLHLYDDDREGAERYLAEGWQSTTLTMPSMPVGDPRPSIRTLLEAEEAIRMGRNVQVGLLGLAPYWLDLVRILQIYAASGDEQEVERIKNDMSSTVYEIYIEKRKAMRPPVRKLPAQLAFTWV